MPMKSGCCVFSSMLSYNYKTFFKEFLVIVIYSFLFYFCRITYFSTHTKNISKLLLGIKYPFINLKMFLFVSTFGFGPLANSVERESNSPRLWRKWKSYKGFNSRLENPLELVVIAILLE